MLLVAQHYPTLSYKKLPEPWWDNFIQHLINNDPIWGHYSVDEHKKMLRAKVKEHGADLIESSTGLFLHFYCDSDATMFVLRWG